MKTFLNVLVCIVAALFSSVLVFTIAVLPLYFSIVSFTNPKTVVNVVQNIDYTDFLLSAEEWQEVISVDGLDAEKIDAFLKSDVVAEALELYAQDFLNATLNDDTDERVLTGDALRDLADRNMDELMEFVKSYIPGDTDIDAEEVEQHIRTAVDTYADTIVEALPLPEPVPEGEEDPFALLRQVLSPAVTVTLCMVLVFSAAIVYACRYKRFQGLLWLGIDSLVATLLVSLIAVVLGGALMTIIVNNVQASLATVVTSVIQVFTRSLILTAVITAVVGAALIVTYVLLRRRKTTSVLPEAVAAEEPSLG